MCRCNAPAQPVKEGFEMNEKEIGEILDDLRDLRNKASYDKDDYDKKFFKENLNNIEKDIEIAFESLNYLKRNPPINGRY